MEVLKFGKKFAIQKIYVNRDMTPLEQKQQQDLRDRCKRARAAGKEAAIKKDQLYIDGRIAPE